VFDKLGVKYEAVPHDEPAAALSADDHEDVGVAMYTPSTGVLKGAEAASPWRRRFEKKAGGFLIARRIWDGGRGAAAGHRAFDWSRVAGQTFVFACGPWLPRCFCGDEEQARGRPDV